MKKNIIILIVILALSPLIIYALSLFIPNYNAYVVTSGSMEPELPTNSIVYTSNPSPNQVNAGDTITFERNHLTITHKVINKTEQGDSISYTTKGVNNPMPDAQPVNHEQVLGKEIFSIPYYGVVPQILSTKEGLFLFIIVPASILLIVEVFRIVSEIKQPKLSSKTLIG